VLLIVLSDQLPVKSLGEPLPHQLADRTRAYQKATGLAVPVFGHKNMHFYDNIKYYPRFHEAIPNFKENYSRVPNPFAAISCDIARLACLIHAASVHSEPGSNSPKKTWLDRLVLVMCLIIGCQRSNLKIFPFEGC
jgi:hypothetical protein